MGNAILLMLCVAYFYGSITNIKVMSGIFSMVDSKAVKASPKIHFAVN